MTYSHAKVQNQRLVGSEDRVETTERTDTSDGQTEAIALPPSLMWSVTTSLQRQSTTDSLASARQLQLPRCDRALKTGILVYHGYKARKMRT